MKIPTAEPLPSEKDALVRLAKGIVLAQGNVFIKELLRSRGIRIGATKADFEANMLEAIEKGELRRHHIDMWLNDVEGWGNQHVYFLKAPKSVSDDPIWHDPQKLESKIKTAGLGAQWNAHTSLEYPSAHALTGVYFEDGILSLVWHKGLELWIRDKQKDYKQEIDADLYEFRAHRMRGDRSVTRFELRPFDKMAAIFVQIAVEEEEHKTALESVKTTVNRLWPFDEFEPFPIANAIKKLDMHSLKGNGISAYSTRLNSGDAYVEFGAGSVQSSYQDSGPVRNVRLAVRQASFAGMNGTFGVPTTGDDDRQRKVRIQLFGKQRRIKLAAQMTATQVWGVLGLIAENV
jgi:hypothetical protein